MINQYYYNKQIRRNLLQFCNIFAGLQVKTGKGECGEEEMITVPIVLSSRDRVASAIMVGNTQNKPFSVPIMAVSMTGLTMSSNRKGIGIVDTSVVLPAGGIYPNDLKAVSRLMPIQYNMSVEMVAYASNTDQLHQILEQILILFDPGLQIQTSDAPLDWTKISSVELTGLNNEENSPPGNDRRIINWSFQFEMPIYISVPLDVRETLIKNIIVTITDSHKALVNEFDANGNLIPAEDEVLASFRISG